MLKYQAALADHPSRLFVEVTSRCNLRCPMCVKQSGNGKTSEGDMAQATFEALYPAFPRLRALVLNGVGEPLLHRHLEELIRAAKERMPHGSWVGFQTNGHLLHRDRALSLLEAGLDRIFLSVDTASPELFKSCREGSELRHMERALTALAEARAARPEARLEVGAEVVLMRDTLRELPATLAWLADRGVSRVIVSHLLPYTEAMTGQTVFGANTEASLELYRTWAARAAAEGVDIGRYFEVLWKYNKTPEERRIVELVMDMSAEAVRAGIPLHIANLISGEDLGQVEAIFLEAEAVAAETGLSLVLPPLRPRNEQACTTVEEGGAFVTWDGRVAPCHFLWRDYTCHFYGRKKQVQPRFFGDLTRESIMEIWNSPAYREFRSDVVNRNYPHCPSCNIYPCDDIERTDFEMDCYCGSVPCGDCLWSLGLLQCLGQEHEASGD